MEPSFSIELITGYYTGKENMKGVIFLGFQLDLKGFGETLEQDSIGCEVKVNILSFQKFLRELKEEIDRLE